MLSDETNPLLFSTEMEKTGEETDKSTSEPTMFDTLNTAIRDGNPDGVRKLIDRYDGCDAYYLLKHSIEFGRKECVELLLSQGARVNAYNYHENLCHSPLHFAVINSDEETVKTLISKCARLDAKGFDQHTPLHLCAFEGNVKMAELLLNHGADINVSTDKGTTPLHMATQKSNISIVKLLLARGACVNAEDSSGDKNVTPLYFAVENECLVIVDEILRHRPDVNLQSNKEALVVAAQKEGPHAKEIIQSLLSSGFTVGSNDPNFDRVLARAIINGHVELIKKIVESWSDVNTLIKFYNHKVTALHLAAFFKQIEIVKLLIKCGADVNARDDMEDTPVFYAVRKPDKNTLKDLFPSIHYKELPGLQKTVVRADFLRTLELLVESGALADIPGRYRLTPLLVAIRTGNIGVVKTLLAFVSNVDDVEFGASCLFYARNDLNMIKFLIENGANVNLKSPRGETVLHRACASGMLPLARILLENGADPNSRCSYGRTPFHAAVHLSNNLQFVKLMLSHNADISAAGENGETPLHLASLSSSRKVMELLVESGAPVNFQQLDGRTPLHFACSSSNLDAVTVLLKHGADVNAKAKDGETPLHVASQRFSQKILKLLLEYGADVDAMSVLGTPLHVASARSAPNIVRLLLEFGSNINATVESHATPLDFAKHGPCPEEGFMHVPKTGSIVCMGNFNFLLRYILRMKAAHMYLNDENLHYLEPQVFDELISDRLDTYVDTVRPHLKDYLSECEKETAALKKETVEDSYMSFYDILLASPSLLSGLSKNESLMATTDTGFFEEKFPLYYRIIQSKLEYGTWRRKIRGQGKEIISRIIPELPDVCLERICGHFINADFVTLIRIFRTPDVTFREFKEDDCVE